MCEAAPLGGALASRKAPAKPDRSTQDRRFLCQLVSVESGELCFEPPVPKSPPVHRVALFSRDRRYRYRVGRRWGDGAAVAFILLNPSTADEIREDPTIRRCIGFARALGYGALEVVNLYAYVATDPAELRRAEYPVGRYNDRHIEAALREFERVVLAWGVHAARLGRPEEVLGLLQRMGVEPHCLRLTASGHPEHPLRLPQGCGLVRFDGEVGKVE